MLSASRFSLSLCLLLVVAGCASDNQTSQDPPVSAAAGPGLHKPAETAPDSFLVKFKTTKGDFLVQVTREWSPNGADHFYELVQAGYYNDCAFFRVLDGFMAQVGINGDPKLNVKWGEANIQDDPVVQSNRRGFVTYAKTDLPNSRSTQFFINYGDANARLDRDGFSPFGRVIDGMDVVDSLYNGYGDGMDQGQIQKLGNVYLKENFPELDYIKTATIVGGDAAQDQNEPDSNDDGQPDADGETEKSQDPDEKPTDGKTDLKDNKTEP